MCSVSPLHHRVSVSRPGPAPGGARCACWDAPHFPTSPRQAFLTAALCTSSSPSPGPHPTLQRARAPPCSLGPGPVVPGFKHVGPGTTHSHTLPLPVPGSWLQGLGNRAPLRHPDVTPSFAFSPRPPKPGTGPHVCCVRGGKACLRVAPRSGEEGPCSAGPRGTQTLEGARSRRGLARSPPECSSRPSQSPPPPFQFPLCCAESLSLLLFCKVYF